MKKIDIINLRNEMELTQVEFAKKIERTQGWLSGVEAGLVRPSKKTALKIIDIAQAHGLDIKYEDLRPKKIRKQHKRKRN